MFASGLSFASLWIHEKLHSVLGYRAAPDKLLGFGGAAPAQALLLVALVFASTVQARAINVLRQPDQARRPTPYDAYCRPSIPSAHPVPLAGGRSVRLTAACPRMWLGARLVHRKPGQTGLPAVL